MWYKQNREHLDKANPPVRVGTESGGLSGDKTAELPRERTFGGHGRFALTRCSLGECSHDERWKRSAINMKNEGQMNRLGGHHETP